MSKLEDIVNRIIDDAELEEENFNPREFADTATETIVIDIDEIKDLHGAGMAYAELVSKKGVGNLSFIYTRLVHPVIAQAFNSGADPDPKKMQDFLYQLASPRLHKDIGNAIHDNLENRIWELVQTDSRMVNVRTKELLRLCIAIAEVVLPCIRDYAMEYADRVPKRNGIGAVIQIDQRASSQVVPPTNSDSLLITLNYGWVYF